jgi:hypothetical protein
MERENRKAKDEKEQKQFRSGSMQQSDSPLSKSNIKGYIISLA